VLNPLIRRKPEEQGSKDWYRPTGSLQYRDNRSVYRTLIGHALGASLLLAWGAPWHDDKPPLRRQDEPRTLALH
jgi:hypothetical protein